MTSFQTFAEYYNYLVTSGDHGRAELDCLFPQLRGLIQIAPRLEKEWTLAAPIPFEVCAYIADFCGFSHLLNVNRFNRPGNQHGIGLTTNPNGSSGMRFNAESAGFYLDAQMFFFGTDDNGTERKISIGDQVRNLPFAWENGLFMELAVDYKTDQVLLKWPNRRGTLRLDLPEHFQNCLLFPLVQTWNGCRATLTIPSAAANAGTT